MTHEILINVTPQETRVAMLEQAVVQELHIERASARGRDEKQDAPSSRLCLNWTNPTVQRLAHTPDGRAFTAGVQVLYVQALLAGHHPLGTADRALMSSALADLVDLAAEATSPRPSPEGSA